MDWIMITITYVDKDWTVYNDVSFIDDAKWDYEYAEERREQYLEQKKREEENRLINICYFLYDTKFMVNNYNLVIGKFLNKFRLTNSAKKAEQYFIENIGDYESYENERLREYL